MNRELGKGSLGAEVGGDRAGPAWRLFFYAACTLNFVVGTLGMLSPEATIDARVIGLLVFCFGIVYFLVARDPMRYASMLWAGVVGKVGVVGLLGPQAIGPSGDPLLVGILSLDAFFALGFLWFLLTKADRAEN